MSRRSTALKLLLLAAPLALGILSLRAFGEPAGRAARRASAALAYPEHDHGVFRIRVRRGSDYHAFAAQALGELARSAARDHGLRAPERVTVLLLESEDDLPRFGLDPARLDQGGLADPAKATIALVGDGRKHDEDLDRRALRHQLTHLLLPRPPSPWFSEGLAAHFETASPQPPAGEDLVALPLLLTAPESEFRGMTRSRTQESARLFTAYLAEQEPAAFAQLLRAEAPLLFQDLSGLEIRWRAWARRPR